VTSVGGITFTYDGNGNRVSRSEGTSTVEYTYDAENRLVEVSNSADPDDTTFVYSAGGARIKRAHGDEATYYIGPIEIETNQGDVTETHSIYSLGGGVNAVRVVTSPGDDGEVTFTFGDHLGSSSTIWEAGDLGDTDPGVRSFQRYYPYGEPRDVYSPALPTDHTFTGQISDGLLDDGGTGLMYYGARYYDPQVGRFAAADTIVPNPGNPQDLNRYTYVGNNPVNFTDPSGHDEPPEDDKDDVSPILPTAPRLWEFAIGEWSAMLVPLLPSRPCGYNGDYSNCTAEEIAQLYMNWGTPRQGAPFGPDEMTDEDFANLYMDMVKINMDWEIAGIPPQYGRSRSTEPVFIELCFLVCFTYGEDHDQTYWGMSSVSTPRLGWGTVIQDVSDLDGRAGTRVGYQTTLNYWVSYEQNLHRIAGEGEGFVDTWLTTDYEFDHRVVAGIRSPSVSTGPFFLNASEPDPDAPPLPQSYMMPWVQQRLNSPEGG
jgi:RHS repeat-associated protein